MNHFSHDDQPDSIIDHLKAGETVFVFRLGTPATYQITIQGRLDGNWADDFDGLTINRIEDDDGKALTILTGRFVDQAALFGVLNRLYGMGFSLLAVACLGVSPAAS